jgi:hypothetical protein
VSFILDDLDKEFTSAEILNNVGQVVADVELTYYNKEAKINLGDLANGVYVLNIKGKELQQISKRFVIAR